MNQAAIEIVLEIEWNYPILFIFNIINLHDALESMVNLPIGQIAIKKTQIK